MEELLDKGLSGDLLCQLRNSHDPRVVKVRSKLQSLEKKLAQVNKQVCSPLFVMSINYSAEMDAPKESDSFLFVGMEGGVLT